MAFQKCPLCNGTGRTMCEYGYNSSQQCAVCMGRRIIDECTGLPPTDVKFETLSNIDLTDVVAGGILKVKV